MCKVSVIIPVYNSEEYLQSCLETIATQTLDDIEAIIVNDGSTDRSLIIATEFSKKYSWFHVFTTENHGVSHARNYGAKQAKGKYFVFVDSDDSVEPDYCRAMYEKAVRDENDLVICQFDRVIQISSDQEHEVWSSPILGLDNYRIKDHRELLIDISVGPWGKLIYRELFWKNPFPEGIRYAEDQAFSVKVFCTAKKIGTVKQVLYHYNYENKSGTTFRFGEERLDWIQVMDTLNEFKYTKEIAGSLEPEMEYFMIAKSIRLCSAAIARWEADWKTRVQLVKEIHSFLEAKIPDWKRNSYYLHETEKRTSVPFQYHTYYKGKKIQPLYCDYGERHQLILICLSRFLSEKMYRFILDADQTLFFTLSRVRRMLRDSSQ